jgi:hypothetical protein
MNADPNAIIGPRSPTGGQAVGTPGQRSVGQADGGASHISRDPNSPGAKVHWNFAITDDAVIFFIGQGMWVYEAAGPQEVSVPRTELASAPA